MRSLNRWSPTNSWLCAPAMLLGLLLGACAASSGSGRAEAAPAPTPRAESEARDLTLVFLKTGPKSGQLSPEENGRAFSGHFANMMRLAEERHLLLAGPFGEPRHDPALRGLFILDTADRQAAMALAETDPTAQLGIFQLEYHTLRTAAPLRALLEREMELEAEARRAKRTRSPGEGGRGYVLLHAADGERAMQALAPLVAEEGRAGPVLLLGRFDHSKVFAILDATDVESARRALGAAAEQAGPLILDAWFASGQLAHLPALAGAQPAGAQPTKGN
ncbi:MAG: YciI family protein [Planctomycetota bacterium]